MYSRTEEEFVRLAENHDVIPVFKEILMDVHTPVSALEIFARDENSFLLESMEGGETWGRYSIIGVQPVPFLETRHTGKRNGELGKLRQIYSGVRVARDERLPRFYGGIVGYLGYEAIGEMERMPAPGSSDLVIPRSRFIRCDCVIVFDNRRHTCQIVICARPADHETAGQAYRDACAVIEAVDQKLHGPREAVATEPHPDVEFRSNMGPEEFERIVSMAKQYIYNGDIIQVVLSQRFTADTNVPPLQLYRALRLLNPSPYTFFLKIGDETLVGSSPEVMVRLTDARVEVRPIAGTRPRGDTPEHDHGLARELMGDAKERAEHVMLVDLGRNDVGRVARSGSVEVTEYMGIERYSHVMHMVSHVKGDLRPEQDAYDVICATFPAGTLSGAPKIRAMEIIRELEPDPRGVYGGAVGYIGFDGNMDLAITIRTLEVRNGHVSIQAGAGIVYDSDPRLEYEETCHKARGMQKAVELAARSLQLDA